MFDHPQSEKLHPWERQRDADDKLEPLLWWGRFEDYRLMGPRRSILESVNRVRDKRGHDRTQNTPGSWRNASKVWNWKQRAEEWDEYERKRETDELEAEREENRKEARKARQALLTTARNIAAKAVWPYSGAASEPRLADLDDANKIALLTSRINRELREEYGELPEQPIDLKSGGKPIKIKMIEVIKDVDRDDPSGDDLDLTT